MVKASKNQDVIFEGITAWLSVIANFMAVHELVC